jgi:hypothetical protein
MESNIGISNVDYMSLLYDDKYVSVYELDAVCLGYNSNNCLIDEDCVKNSLASFANKPLYCIIDNRYNQLDSAHNDFLEHFREEFPERATRDRIIPFGSIPESSLENAKLTEKDGKTFLRIQVVVWKKLLPHISEILQKRDGSVRISVEFAIEDYEVEEGTGILIIKKFNITAVTALGEKVQEVMEGAGLKTLKFAKESLVDECNKLYLSFSKQNKYEVPQDVLKNVKEAESLKKQYGRGGNKNSITFANDVLGNREIFDVQVKNAAEYFAKLEKEPAKTDPPTNKYISYLMFGGNSCKEWVNSIVCSGDSSDTIYNSEEGGKERMQDEEIKDVANAEVDTPADEKEEGVKNADPEVPAEEKAEEEADKGAEEIKNSFDESKFAEIEQKCSALEQENLELKEKMAAFIQKEEFAKSMAMIEEFAHCFSEEDKSAFVKNAESMSFAEVECGINAKAIAFAKLAKAAKPEDEDKELSFSVNPFHTFDSDKETISAIDKVLKKNKTIVK